MNQAYNALHLTQRFNFISEIKVLRFGSTLTFANGCLQANSNENITKSTKIIQSSVLYRETEPNVQNYASLKHRINKTMFYKLPAARALNLNAQLLLKIHPFPKNQKLQTTKFLSFFWNQLSFNEMVLLHCQVAYTYVFEFRPQKQEREGESLVLFQI